MTSKRAYTFRRYVETTQRITIVADNEMEAREQAEQSSHWWNNFHTMHDTILEDIEDQP
jgi:hypothetical protein